MDGIQNFMTKSTNKYRWLMENGDPRVKDWPLVDSPLITIIACVLYVYGAKIAGPKLMSNRKPLQLRELMLVYNLFMVILNGYIFYQAGIHGWFGKYNLLCQPMDYSMSVDGYGMARVSWVYFISKFVDFFDTLFFVLRKKNNQISNLHVIHHSLMPCIVWSGLKFCPGGHGTFSGFLNSFIHIVMYTYYFLAAFGPKVQKYLWWKKYITTMQMLQFIIVFLHGNLLLIYDCGYPKVYAYELMCIATLFFILFSNYFRQTYVKKRV
ncbi:elongation of very long chain fatty acids protein AAEL008004-like [Tetranychus urticae]|uniref:elongation of very long chain fatty acids protein AAEL008004-like n=1 Tax=Tetranychus urticae TaxID=32264 RepID=UPI00077BBDB3|nr:elongation of very long chain fatty acids protein AAEL008004-like [Tetranychus urticae]